jgi:hypothetical protein
VVAGSVPDSVYREPVEDPVDRAAIYTIELVFTDDTVSDHQVLCLGLDPVYEQAENHFMATHNHPDVTLSHLIIRNQEDVIMARWEGVSTR